MIVTLHRKQRVSVGSRIRFEHQSDSGQKHEVSLNERQFANLDDVIFNLDKYPSVRYFPLGGSLWFYRKDATIQIIDNNRQSFFWFYAKAWHYYVTRVHPSLYAVFYHGKTYRHQHDEKYESQSKDSFRRSPSHFSESYKTLSRTTRNGCYENDNRSQYANVSRRKGTNSRSRVREGCRKYAARIHRKVETDQDNATISSDENDSVESCDECSVEEGDCSPQDQID